METHRVGFIVLKGILLILKFAKRSWSKLHRAFLGRSAQGSPFDVLKGDDLDFDSHSAEDSYSVGLYLAQ